MHSLFVTQHGVDLALHAGTLDVQKQLFMLLSDPPYSRVGLLILFERRHWAEPNDRRCRGKCHPVVNAGRVCKEYLILRGVLESVEDDAAFLEGYATMNHGMVNFLFSQ